MAHQHKCITQLSDPGVNLVSLLCIKANYKCGCVKMSAGIQEGMWDAPVGNQGSLQARLLIPWGVYENKEV